MKKLSLITKMLAIMLVLNFSCSVESNEYTLENDLFENSNNNQSRLGIQPISSPCDTTRLVYAKYEFNPVINGTPITLPPQFQAQIKANFESEMSQHFTICEVLETECPDVDTWIVSKIEYDNYANSDPTYGSGTNGKIIVEEEDGWQDNSGIPGCIRR